MRFLAYYLYVVRDVLSIVAIFIQGRLTILQGIGEKVGKDLSHETKINKYGQILI